MSFGDLYAMPADEAELSALLAYTYGRGRTTGRRAHRPLTVACKEHAILRGPEPGCTACIEASAYCPHNHLMAHHFGAEPGDWCWRPRYRDEAGEPGAGNMHDDCVFCAKIAANDVERLSPFVVAFTPLNPVTPGHLLVVPVQHVADVAESAWVSALTMSVAARVAADAGDCNIITSRGEAATQSVRHLHLHVVPRRAGDGLALPWTGQEVVAPGPCPRIAHESGAALTCGVDHAGLTHGRLHANNEHHAIWNDEDDRIIDAGDSL